MKIRDLIEKLKQFDGNIEVLCSSEDSGTFSILEISEISSVDAEKCRGEDGVPFLKLKKSEHSERHILIEVTSDF